MIKWADLLSIVVMLVMFLCSLGGAYVLFRLLKSTATIQKKGYRAGGALAGFLLIYGLLYYSYDRMNKSYEAPSVAVWTIKGTVQKSDAANHKGITVRNVPPTPMAITDARGSFRLEGVRTLGGEDAPGVELYIENNGYYPVPLSVNQKNATYDKKDGTITLAEDIKLQKSDD